jgi:hypothetical protein
VIGAVETDVVGIQTPGSIRATTPCLSRDSRSTSLCSPVCRLYPRQRVFEVAISPALHLPARSSAAHGPWARRMRLAKGPARIKMSTNTALGCLPRRNAESRHCAMPRAVPERRLHRRPAVKRRRKSIRASGRIPFRVPPASPAGKFIHSSIHSSSPSSLVPPFPCPKCPCPP